MGSQTFEVRCDHEALQFSLGSLMWPRVKGWSTRGSRGGSDAAPTGPQASKSVRGVIGHQLNLTISVPHARKVTHREASVQLEGSV